MTKSDTELRAELKKLRRELKARERFNPDDINENDVILVVKRVKTSDESITLHYGTVVKTSPKYEERSYVILFVGGRFWVTGSPRPRTFDELVSEVLIKDEIVYACRMTQAAVLDGWAGGQA